MNEELAFVDIGVKTYCVKIKCLEYELAGWVISSLGIEYTPGSELQLNKFFWPWLDLPQNTEGILEHIEQTNKNHIFLKRGTWHPLKQSLQLSGQVLLNHLIRILVVIYHASLIWKNNNNSNNQNLT